MFRIKIGFLQVLVTTPCGHWAMSEYELRGVLRNSFKYILSVSSKWIVVAYFVLKGFYD